MKRWRPESRQLREDDTMRADVLARANYLCELCGHAAEQVHHVITRRYQSTRHQRRNGVAVCTACHEAGKVWAWLEKTDPARYAWAVRERGRVHRKTDAGRRTA